MFDKYFKYAAVQKNLFRTVCLFLLFAILCSLFYIPFYSYCRKITHSVSLEHYQSLLLDNMHMLDMSLNAVNSANTVLISTGTSISTIFNRNQLDNTKLSSTRHFLSNYFAPFDFINEYGITFRDEPVLDRFMIFYELPVLRYPNYLSSSQEDYWKQFADSKGILEATGFNSYLLGQYDAVTIYCKLSNRNHAYLFAHYPTDALYKLFASDELLPYCRIAIFHGDKLIAENVGFLDETYSEIEASSISPFGIRVVLQIPESYLSKDLLPLKHLFTILISVFSVISIILIIAFALAASKPFTYASNVLYSSGHVEDALETMNSTEFLVSAIHNISSKLTDYHSLIESQRKRGKLHILERALYRGLYTEDSCSAFNDMYPDFPACWQLALIQFISEPGLIDANAIQAAIFQHFRDLNSRIFCLTFSQNAVLVLFPVDSLMNPQQELKDLSAQYEAQYPVSLSYFIGDAYDSPTMLSYAFQQIEHSSILLKPNTLVSANKVPSLGISQLQTIYYSLQSGEYEIAIATLKNCTEPFIKSRDPIQAKYTYQALSYILLELESENRSLTDITIPVFNSSCFAYVFEYDFPMCFKEICSRLIQDRAKEAESLDNELLNYIKENYSDQQLSISSVIDHFHISAPTLQKRMNESTGKTFSAYVEKIRMEHARELLLTKEFPIQEISEMIGYTNTNSFYKAYRRVFSESPRTTRQRHQS